MENINIDQLTQVVALAKELESILTTHPEVAEFMREHKGDADHNIMVPVKMDKLIGTSQAAKVLYVNEGKINEYVKQGILKAYYTPDCSYKKFWLSQVKALAKEGKAC